MNRIERKFKQLKKEKKKAFIAFLTAGYPSLKITKKLILEFDRIGVDIIELGVPFSDPLADGPVIQEASLKALEKHVHLIGILNLVKEVRRLVKAPLCFMTYYNPVFCFGEEKFVRLAVECGVDGLIIPDLPPEEGKSLIRLAQASGLDIICFLSPTSSLKRIKFVAQKSKGFIYYVSLTGVTGQRKNLSAGLSTRIKLIKKYTSKPVCVGFGVSESFQVKQINEFADGVIVGSAIVNKIRENISEKDLVRKVSNFVKGLI